MIIISGREKSPKWRMGMTKEIKEKVLEAINRNTLHNVPPNQIIDAANEIEKIIDKEISDVMVKVCEFGEILDAFGLEIVSKN